MIQILKLDLEPDSKIVDLANTTVTQDGSIFIIDSVLSEHQASSINSAGSYVSVSAGSIFSSQFTIFLA